MRSLNKNLKHIAIVIALVLVFAQFALPAFAKTSSAQTAITQAQNELKNSYLAVKDAEDAGANVGSLMVTLDDAAGLLTKAQLAYASNNNSAAYTFAVQCQSKLGGFDAQAAALKQSALASDNQNTKVTVLLLVSAVGIACGGIAAVVFMNKQQRKQMQ